MWNEARQAILNSSDASSVYIGCDSKVFKGESGRWFAKYTTVVVVHMDSRHGAKIYHHSEELPDFKNIRTRMVTEASFAISAFDAIADIIGNRHVAIHLDINPSPEHKSNTAAKEAIGYVWGTTGIKPDIKPNAFAASYAADHCVRGKNHW